MIGRALLASAMAIAASLADARAAEIYPTNSVSYLAYVRNPIGLWKTNFREVPAERRISCWIWQSDMPLWTTCRQGLAPKSILFKDESAADFGTDYMRVRLSLFEVPIPIVPPFQSPKSFLNLANLPKFRPFPQAPGLQVQRLPLDQLATVTDKASFGKDSGSHLNFAVFYQMALTTSFESTEGIRVLESAWNYWERAADSGNRSCIRVPEMFDGCFVAIRLSSSGHRTEPSGFQKGVALCVQDQRGGFMRHCIIVTMESRDGKRYVRAMVAPTRGMGGGNNLADDFGAFALVCKFSTGSAKDGLLRVKSTFGIDGTYELGNPFKIDAYSRFQRFAAASRYGKFKMEGAQLEARVFSAVFYGKWSKENRDFNGIPSFEDDDVQMFKQIFEKELGGGASCSVIPKAKLSDIL